MARGPGAIAHVRLAGTGAGTFAFTHYRFRDQEGVVRHAHSQWLNVLSELGVIGLVLFVLAMVLALAACIRQPVGRSPRPAASRSSSPFRRASLAFIVHLSWDWDWDMAAVGTIVFLFAGVAASYLEPRGQQDAAAQRGAGGPGGPTAVAAGSGGRRRGPG